VMKVRQSAKNNESNGSTEYDFKKAEERWSKYWQERGFLKLMDSWYEAQTVRAGNVPLPLRQASHGHVRNYSLGMW